LPFTCPSGALKASIRIVHSRVPVNTNTG
jgi:hypothetical protein